MGIFAGFKPKIEVLQDNETLAAQCVDHFIKDARKTITQKGVFYVALSGGSTPKRFFELLGENKNSRELAWNKIQLFWVDERYVPPHSQWSNYKLAKDTFLDKVPIPEDNIHRIPTEESDFNIAAKSYEQTLRRIFNINTEDTPQFDLIVLGMGTDGHTASLFPNNCAIFDTRDLACVVYVLDEKLNRITLTHPVICAARHLMILVSGSEKAQILKEVMTSEPDEILYPIHILWPILDKVTWLIDNDAAKLLPDQNS